MLHSAFKKWGYSLCGVVLLGSCEINEPVNVPAYLHVGKVNFTIPDSNSAGTAIQEFGDAWITVDGEFIGAFEIPTTIPILKTGAHEVLIQPGVILNDDPTTRNPYHSVTPFRKTVNLQANVTLHVDTFSSHYASDVKFDWLEDFNIGSKTIDTTKTSTVPMVLSNEYAYRSNKGAGIIMNLSTDRFEIKSKTSYTFSGSSPYFLEMHYNSNVSVTISAYDATLLPEAFIPLVTVPSTNGKWRKVYIDFTRAKGIVQSDAFNVLLSGSNTTGGKGYVYLDNFKLIHIQ